MERFLLSKGVNDGLIPIMDQSGLEHRDTQKHKKLTPAANKMLTKQKLTMLRIIYAS